MTRPKQWTSSWEGILWTAAKTHWDWDNGGRKGAGRLVVVDTNLRGASVANLRAARFERCDFSGSRFAMANLDEIELLECILEEAILTATNLRHANISGSRFHGAWLGL